MLDVFWGMGHRCVRWVIESVISSTTCQNTLTAKVTLARILLRELDYSEIRAREESSPSVVGGMSEERGRGNVFQCLSS